MIAWDRQEPFCNYAHRRRQQRLQWIATLRSNAANEHSARLADKLAKAWRIT